MISILRNKKFAGLFKPSLIGGALIMLLLSGCALFQPPPCGKKCAAEIACNNLNDKFFGNEKHQGRNVFRVARLATKNKLAKRHCEFGKGLVLPPNIDEWGKRPTRKLEDEPPAYEPDTRKSHKQTSAYIK